MMFPVVIQNMEWWLAGCAKGQMKVKRELTFVLCVGDVVNIFLHAG